MPSSDCSFRIEIVTCAIVDIVTPSNRSLATCIVTPAKIFDNFLWTLVLHAKLREDCGDLKCELAVVDTCLM